MKVNNHVLHYIELYRTGKIKLNRERQALIEHLETRVLNRDDLYFDEVQINNCITFAEKWYFPLNDFQRFLIAFVFFYHKEDDSVFFDQFLWLMARGAGKNGLITVIAHFLISPLHGIPKYNVSIVANSEKQAKTSFVEMYETIETKPELKEWFYCTKKEIKSVDTNSLVQYHTSNASTKDGLRDGAVIYDEIHQYETAETVNVFSSGLGKVKNAREFFIGTDGYVREGFLDKMKERTEEILKGEAPEDGMFPFICKIDDLEEMDNPENWEKSNPMFSEPRGLYAKGLYKKVLAQYRQLESNPSGKEEFVTKRMNFPMLDVTKTVATWEEILATNRQMPDLRNRTCVGGLDFASIRDFAAVGLLFKEGEEYFWKSHSFVRQGFLDNVKLKAPIKEWEELGLLTIVDEPVIDIQHIVGWFVQMRELYGLQTIVADTFRLDLVKTALEAEGFNLIYIRNPKAIHSLLAPRVETLFANGKINFGDSPLMRWYTNNVFVKIKKDGNKEYLKKDEVRRKTDGFQAFIHALWQADNILEEETEFMLDDIAF